MESFFRPPEPLQLDGNIAENWKKFSQKIDNFMIAAGFSTKPDDKKLAVFLNLIGDDALDLYNTFDFGTQVKTLELVKNKFDEYCLPKKNVIFERFVFNSIVQKEAQSFDNFVTELRKAVKTTEYEKQDDMIRDRIVMGINNKTTQEKLLREDKLTLQKAVEICRAIEISKDQSKILQNEASVSEVKTSKNNKQKCRFCGYVHVARSCPAWGKTCAKCEGRNHFASVCFQENNGRRDNDDQSVTWRRKKENKVKKKSARSGKVEGNN